MTYQATTCGTGKRPTRSRVVDGVWLATPIDDPAGIFAADNARTCDTWCEWITPGAVSLRTSRSSTTRPFVGGVRCLLPLIYRLPGALPGSSLPLREIDA
jgi:hypothetical protein